ncbi:hypothetical protein SLEP1_g7164 [Rubroshorea leprosula]|uniref:Uncharacterized protein n=1 Tax=Rubroshorea leprosula TaxID=152421 RepID=A0AAV5I239_9ROSI|nr:hypothetical protein SLEP1_g7164 [Rubroshorea leprosula]
MASLRSYLLTTLLLVLIFTAAVGVRGDDKAKGNGKGSSGNNDNGKGKGGDNNNKGNGNNGNGKGNGGNNNNKGNENNDKDETNYDVRTGDDGREHAYCKGKGSACYGKSLVCPAECPERKPKQNKKKGCHVNCGSKCEVTCKSRTNIALCHNSKWKAHLVKLLNVFLTGRKPNCDGYGTLCYDPRFVGGDGVMFYFHGAKGGNFAIVSDDNLQINAHFIGTRPQGRTRDFTWVQALAVMFDTHTLVVAANKVSHWDDSVDALSVRWDGETINIPEDEWRIDTDGRKVVVERTDEWNSVKVTVSGLVELNIRQPE